VRDPFLFPAIGFAVGIVLARFAGVRAADVYPALALFLFALFVSRYRRWCVAPLFCCLGALAFHWRQPGAAPLLDAASGEVVLLEGCVVEPPAFFEDKEQFVLELAPGARVRAQLYPKDGESPPALRYGQRVEVEARVRTPRNFGNPGAFNYVEYLARRHIYWHATVRSGTTPRVLDGDCGSRAMAWIYGLRAAVLDRVERTYGPDAYNVGLLQALLVGESSRLERIWADHYRRTGTYHAIVVSGLHVTVIGGVLILLFRLLAMHRAAARFAAVAFVWVYAGMCGWQAPVVRSAGGFTMFAIGGFFFRRVRLANLLSVLALAFLVNDPAQLFEASFQLTFLAVAALGGLAAPATENGVAAKARGVRHLADEGRDLHMAPRVAQFRVELRLMAETLQLCLRMPMRAARALVCGPAWAAMGAAEVFAASAAVQFGLALPMIYYFHRLSFSGLTANLVVTPALTAAVPLGFVSLFSGWEWTAWLTRVLVDVARAVAEWHAGWEPNWRVPDPPVWLAALFFASLVMVVRRRTRAWVGTAAFLLVVMAVHPFAEQRAAGTLEMTVTDVGQGDSVLVGFPDGKWMVVDGGGIPVFGKRPRKARMDIGEDVVTPYLLSRGIRRVDVLVNTHQHDDHAAGLVALMENFRPVELWVGATPPSEAFGQLHLAAARLGVVVRAMRQGPAFDFGGARVRVVAPTEEYEPRAAPSNNDSLVLRVEHGKHAFLLTGDMERQMEYAVAEQVGRVDVLKVAHHGSKTSTTEAMLEAARPAVAIVSAGKDNLFRHPHPDVMARLAARHVTTLRTDEWGLVTVRSDGRRLSMETNRWGLR
jgi:competence protein ComEC